MLCCQAMYDALRMQRSLGVKDIIRLTFSCLKLTISPESFLEVFKREILVRTKSTTFSSNIF